MTATEQGPGSANGVDHDVSNNLDTAPIVPPTHSPLELVCGQVHGAISRFLASDVSSQQLRRVQVKTEEAIGVILKTLESYDPSEISLSYNGGKDCLVLLILYLYSLHEHYIRRKNATRFPRGGEDRQSDAYSQGIQSVYIKTPHPFPEVETFVQQCEETYSLNLTRYTTPMKAAFASYLADFPSVRAIFVGTRRTDPHGANLTHFDETDHGWPKFMRVHPVINWHYVEIWSFIKHFDIPYCELYDKGYTSLGGTTDTWPNPALQLPSSTAEAPKFKPAHELVLDEEERLGREQGVSGSARLLQEDKKHAF